ncbi:beta-lactamase domain protein [Desulfosarcina variabilis str. Montpellier]
MLRRGLCLISVLLLALTVQLNCSNIAHADVTVDNSEMSNTESTGSWSVSSGSDPFGPSDATANSLWASGGEDTFTWLFQAPQTGTYEVWEWHSGWSSKWSSRTTAAPHQITHASGTTNVLVNQRIYPGQWNSLGMYPFVAGETYAVTVTSVADSFSTCADAIRWTFNQDGATTPMAVIDTVSPNPVNKGDAITFAGHGSDSEGTITSYQWRSSLDGVLSNSEQFSVSNLSAGTHTIFFEVQNETGVWSKADSIVLEIDTTVTETFPEENWNTATPESQGVDSASLQQAMNYMDNNFLGNGSDRTVVIRNGYKIWEGSELDVKEGIYSATKVFTSTVLGLVIDDGLVDIDAYVKSYLPQIDGTYSQYENLLVRHLATMTSGYNGLELPDSPCPIQGSPVYARCEYDLIPSAPEVNPGEHWAYRDQNLRKLAEIIIQESGESLESKFRNEIADPIGMTNWDWKTEACNIDGVVMNEPTGYCLQGIHTVPEDLARLGLLYLNKGNWNGEQLLSESFVNNATTNQVPASTPCPSSVCYSGRYGYYWRVNGLNSENERLMPDAPPNAYYAYGYKGNFLFVIPEWNMVIARQSAEEGSSLVDKWNEFFKILTMGITISSQSS